MRHSIVSDGLSTINNSEKVGKEECEVEASGSIFKILKLIQSKGYIGNFEKMEDGRGGKFRVSLEGNINELNVIRPHFFVKADGFEEWEKRYLPAKGLGILIVSTPQGIITHTEAKEKGTGGRLLAYIY